MAKELPEWVSHPELVLNERFAVNGDSGRHLPYLTPLEIKWYGDEIKRQFTPYYDSDGFKKYDISDRRKQVIIKRCLLCNQIDRLILSHIHPAWTGRTHQAEGGFFAGYKNSEGVETVTTQDYSKHYLLCAKCENLIGTSENYVRALSHGQPVDLQALKVVRHPDYLVTGLQKNMLFRFIASFLFRSHGAISAPHIRLNYSFANELRTAIVQNSYPSSRHQLSIAKCYSSVPNTNALAVSIRHLALGRKYLKFEAVLGGFYWVYFMRSFDRKSSGWDDDLFRIVQEDLSIKDSEAYILPVDLIHLNIVKEYHGVSAEEEYESLPLELKKFCACGWGVGTFEECCAYTWFREMNPELAND